MKGDGKSRSYAHADEYIFENPAYCSTTSNEEKVTGKDFFVGRVSAGKKDDS